MMCVSMTELFSTNISMDGEGCASDNAFINLGQQRLDMRKRTRTITYTRVP